MDEWVVLVVMYHLAGHTPAEVCFTAGMRKLLKKKIFSRPAKTIPTGQQLTTEVKRELFSMASTPAGLYQLALILQVLLASMITEAAIGSLSLPA